MLGIIFLSPCSLLLNGEIQTQRFLESMLIIE